jgi:hypothetical protein
MYYKFRFMGISKMFNGNCLKSSLVCVKFKGKI